jgi:hypothetical protein
MPTGNNASRFSCAVLEKTTLNSSTPAPPHASEKNQIKVLHDGDRVLYNHADKAKLLRDFYVGLLGTSTPPVWGFDLTAFMHSVAGLRELEKPFTIQEAKEAVWSMRTDSSPGADGFGPAFFRTFWDVVSPDLMAFLQDFNDGVAPSTDLIELLFP